MFQVELKGEFMVKLLNILEWREVMLRKRAITQAKVQWQHFGPDEDTWKDEQFMREAYPGLFVARKHWDNARFQEGEM